MRNGRYILDEQGNPVEEPELLKWAEWFENSANRRVALTFVENKRISTVFLGLDHSFSNAPDAVPVLWETMVFGGEHDEYQERYTSKDAALEGHWRIVEMCGGAKELTI